ncbi:MAG: amidohydrolase [Acidobacteriota bacterium]
MRKTILVICCAAVGVMPVSAVKAGVEDVANFDSEAAVHGVPRPELNLEISEWVDGHLPSLLGFYRERHQTPELSLYEKESARAVAARLRSAGYSVTTEVGGYGVVGILQNGEGPTVLIRGDMDALPITETTGLAYASTVRVEQADGRETGVMHACGHDIHMTNLVGTASALAAIKHRWQGTVVIAGQPAEEIGVGAAAMIADGLFERFPKPDFCLGLHVSPVLPAGTLAYSSGWATANVDSVDITIFGHGGHGARPHETIDPIVTASQVVMALQTLTSRRIDPVEGGVVTVGSIHGGSKHNIIPGEVRLQLTVRSFSDGARKILLEGIRKITVNTCRAMGCPQDPEVTIREGEFTPSGYNDPALAAAAAGVMAQVVGPENVFTIPALTVGEDFGRYARELGVPGLLFWLGSVNTEVFVEAQAEDRALPSIHSSDYAPDPGPTLETGIRTMTALALSLLGVAP